jgi:threonine/homoserine/homoserine lactone efflux protein
VPPTPLAFLLQGIALGITAAGSPGPFQAYLVNLGLSGSLRRGLSAALAPLISDAVIVTTIMLLLTRLPQTFLRFVGLAGGVFSLYLAWGLWKAWRAANLPFAEASSVNLKTSLWATLWQAVLLNSLSPGPYTFWTLVNGPLLLDALRLSTPHGLAFLAGFYSVFVAGNMLVVLLFHQARRLGPQSTRWLTLLSTLILAGFGLFLIGRALTRSG